MLAETKEKKDLKFNNTNTGVPGELGRSPSCPTWGQMSVKPPLALAATWHGNRWRWGVLFHGPRRNTSLEVQEEQVLFVSDTSVGHMQDAGAIFPVLVFGRHFRGMSPVTEDRLPLLHRTERKKMRENERGKKNKNNNNSSLPANQKKPPWLPVFRYFLCFRNSWVGLKVN